MATETNTLPLVRTKLYRPRITGDLVPRPRLLERLDRRQGRPLTLVLAPAGYGKTTPISSWLEVYDHPSAWLSLDENDDDLSLFLTYLLAAIRTIIRDACGDTLAILWLVVASLLLAGVALAESPVLHRVEGLTVAGDGYQQTSLGWQICGVASGGAYRVLSPAAPTLRGSGCCCTYLPIVVRNYR